MTRVQTVIWTPEHSAFELSRALDSVLDGHKNTFDGEMTVNSLPDNAPVDLPHIQLRSKEGDRTVSIAPARADCSWLDRLAETSMERLSDWTTECLSVLKQYKLKMDVSVGRVGLVVERAHSDGQPAQTIIDRFCNDQSKGEPFDRSENFEIHNHKVYNAKRPGMDFDVNSWVRCRSARHAVSNQPMVSVIQDLNSKAEEVSSRQFAANDLDEFFSAATHEANDILSKYFPGKG